MKSLFSFKMPTFEIFVCLVILTIMTTIFLGKIAPVNKDDVSINIRVIEGCEYIVNPTYGDYNVLTHKGNCTNISHRIFNLEKH